MRVPVLLIGLILACEGFVQRLVAMEEFEMVHIASVQAADVVESIQFDADAIMLPAPVEKHSEAIWRVRAAVNFVPPKRTAQHGEWFFFPRLDQAQDDLTFQSGFAVRRGEQVLWRWTNDATDLARWTFEQPELDINSPEPASGQGTALLFGGTAGSLRSAAPQRSRRAWNTSGYAPQGTASGTRGVQFNVSTAGFSNIVASFDHRSSRSGSRWARVDYTIDGTNFLPLWTNQGALSPPDQFQNVRLDLRLVRGVNNNPDFGFRVVSIFSPLGFQENREAAWSPPDSAYMRASDEASYTMGMANGRGAYGMDGAWRFDNVAVTGVALDEWTKRLPQIEVALFVCAFLIAAGVAIATPGVLAASLTLLGLMATCFAGFHYVLPWACYLQTGDEGALVDQASLPETLQFLLLALAGMVAFAAAIIFGRWICKRIGLRRTAPDGH